MQFVPTPTECSECHTDIHRGRFDRDPTLSIVNGNKGCERCHTTSSFTKLNWSAKDHSTWTGYALNGKHATTSCTDCHKPQPLTGLRTTHWGLASRNCSSCHTDIHAGQFAIANITDCARCHTDRTSKFTPSTFDHQRDSVFKLDAQHVTLACAACHRAVQMAPGLSAVRYRPLGTRCVDCHGAGITGTKESR